MKLKLAVALLAILPAIYLVSQISPAQHVGPLPGGGFLLNSGWVISPVGQQTPVDTFPMREVSSPDGKYLLVLNGGYNPPSISVVNAADRHEVQRQPVPDAWLGLTFAPNGKTVYVGGGSKARVYEFAFDASSGRLTPARDFSAVDNEASPGKTFIGDVAVSPDGHFLYAADLLEDRLAVINLQSGRLIDRWKSGRRPYRILIPPGGKNLLVSSWADAAVYAYDSSTGAR